MDHAGLLRRGAKCRLSRPPLARSEVRSGKRNSVHEQLLEPKPNAAERRDQLAGIRRRVLEGKKGERLRDLPVLGCWEER